jgi:endoglucanase
MFFRHNVSRFSFAVTFLLTLFQGSAQSQIVDSSRMQRAVSPAEPLLVVDQLGYGVSWRKLAFRTFRDIKPTPKPDELATVMEADSQRVVLTLNLPIARQDPQTQDWIQTIDFSDLQKPGRYVLQVGLLQTAPFEIGDNVYVNASKALVRSFYLQRCGVALDDAQTGLHHAVCHAADGSLAHDDEVNAQGLVIQAAGGWHDAGDYGKYVATAAVSIGRILNAFERASSSLSSDDLNIPESHNGLPDLLDEMRIGLDWMLKMQRRDGAVYRKIGGAQWPLNQSPDQDDKQRSIYGVSSADTAKAAAAWALAARIYKSRVPEQATIYLLAAKRAWAWLEIAAPNRFDYKDGDDSGSGPYRQNDTDIEPTLAYDWDDKLWAATELYLTTNEPHWLDYLRKYLPTAPLNIFEWKDPSALAMSYLLWHPALKSQDDLVRFVRPRFLLRAKHVIDDMADSGYLVANNKFIWGSNKMTLEEGLVLCHAYEVNKDPRFLAAARDQLHYIFGRNYFGKSFVSEVGSNSVQNVNHLFATSVRLKIPGLLVGGPNELEQSNIAPRNLGLRSWIDDNKSYATNEYAIDYNAALIGLIVALGNHCHTP